MTKLYKKSEIAFAILWIVAYVVLTSLADQLSESAGVVKSVTAALHIVMSLVLFFWIRKNDLGKKYGFCRSEVPAKRFLYYLPLIVAASTAFWGGIKLQYGFPGAALYFVSMCCVGFLEEVIFRGLLFRAMEKNNLRAAIIVSALTFGIGHIVNLIDLLSWQVAASLYPVPFGKQRAEGVRRGRKHKPAGGNDHQSGADRRRPGRIRMLSFQGVSHAGKACALNANNINLNSSCFTRKTAPFRFPKTKKTSPAWEV